MGWMISPREGISLDSPHRCVAGPEVSRADEGGIEAGADRCLGRSGPARGQDAGGEGEGQADGGERQGRSIHRGLRWGGVTFGGTIVPGAATHSGPQRPRAECFAFALREAKPGIARGSGTGAKSPSRQRPLTPSIGLGRSERPPRPAAQGRWAIPTPPENTANSSEKKRGQATARRCLRTATQPRSR